jgi:hypothetical protein
VLEAPIGQSTPDRQNYFLILAGRETAIRISTASLNSPLLLSDLQLVAEAAPIPAEVHLARWLENQYRLYVEAAVDLP